MSNGTASGNAPGAEAKANDADGSMNFVINQAEDTRSIPGRGRVIQVRFWNLFFRPEGPAGKAPPDSVSRANKLSARLRSGLSKKSIATISWKRRRRRESFAANFADRLCFLSSEIRAA